MCGAAIPGYVTGVNRAAKGGLLEDFRGTNEGKLALILGVLTRAEGKLLQMLLRRRKTCMSLVRIDLEASEGAASAKTNVKMCTKRFRRSDFDSENAMAPGGFFS